MARPTLLFFLLSTLFLTAQSVRKASATTEASRGPDRSWRAMPTRTLADLPPLAPDPQLGTYGGVPTAHPHATGFFHTKKRGKRWWLVDPEGLPYLHRGIVSIKKTRTAAAAEALLTQFGNEEGWVQATSGLLKSIGFNGIGPWSDDETLAPARHQLSYTKIWNFMSSYGKRRGGTYQKSGHLGYPGNCPFIFEPEFALFCNERAKQLVAFKDDPWLLGHFTDNELPWHLEMLDRYLSLPEDDAGHQAAQAWLTQRYAGKPLPKTWTDEDRIAFVGYAADTYFGIVSQAIRAHDPNHLILGSRFHGSALNLPSLFEAAGRHCDVISANYYHRWTPEQTRIRKWSQAAQKPILITEWYAKGVDSGLANTSGAGWLVKTQADRGRFYQNFTLGLLESQVCVGWHWFRYSDNDPNQKGTDPSNRDANKGIVSSHYHPYQPLLDAMKAVNERSYRLISQFDNTSSQP